MMKTEKRVVTTPVVGLLSGIALAGISQPAAILYDSITIDGQTVTESDPVAVIARVDGVPNSVSTDHPADNPGVTDQRSDGTGWLLLRMRLEDLEADSRLSDIAALVGQTVLISVLGRAES